MIDTKRLREQYNAPFNPHSVIRKLCDELDQARADMLKLRDALKYEAEQGENVPTTVQLLADTEHYEAYSD